MLLLFLEIKFRWRAVVHLHRSTQAQWMSSTLSQWRPYKLNFILGKIKGSLIWWRQSALNEDCVWVVEKHYISVSCVVAYNRTMTRSTFNVHPFLHPSALCPGPGHRGNSLSRKADNLPTWLNSTQLESTLLNFLLFFHYNWVPTSMCVVVVIATRPKVLNVLCMQHKDNKTMEDMETMVYLVLGPQLFVRHGVFVCCVFCSHFPHCQVLKMVVLVVVKKSLTWLIKWRN